MSHEAVARTLVGALVLAIVGASCGNDARSSQGSPDLRGQRLEVMAVWSGAEEESFAAVLRAFERRTGAGVTYTSAGRGLVTSLDARLAEGRPPDVAFLPQPGLLRRYATEGRLVRLDAATRELVERNYGSIWRSLGSEGGRLYGVWFKAANKSLVWYRLAAFEQLGLVPPEDLDGLLAVAEKLAESGTPAFSVGGRDGWTLTDWFENLYLRQAGLDQYDRLSRHEIPWTDESVKATLRLLARLLEPRLLAGGLGGALAANFETSVQVVFMEPAGAAMVVEGDFVAGVIRGKTTARIGVDADAFPFPPVPASGDGTRPPAAGVVGGGDAAVLLRPSPAGAALLRYLATPEAGALWAERGGFLSPNRNLDLAVYPDELTRSLARALLEAGDAFRFDLSDLLPAAFGATEGRGLRAGLQDFLRTRDVEATAARLEADASAAFRE